MDSNRPRPLVLASTQPEYLVTSSTISIVLCTYNGEKYLPALLESLLNQTLLPIEFIWRDDRSTDSTAQIAADFARQAPFPVDFAVNPQNLGPKLNFGNALSSVSGTLIALCDQDDVWLPEKLETMARHFNDRETKLVYSDCLVVDDSLESSGQTFLQQRGTQHPQKDTLSCLLLQNTVTGCVSMFTSDLLPIVLPIPELAIMHDWWLGLIASAVGRVVHVPEITTLYRQHGGNVIGAPKRFALASFRESGVPFGIWRKAGRKFLVAANQAIALQDRLIKRKTTVPEPLAAFVGQLRKSRFGLWRSCRKHDIQRGEWIRNLNFAIGLLAYRRTDLVDSE